MPVSVNRVVWFLAVLVAWTLPAAADTVLVPDRPRVAVGDTVGITLRADGLPTGVRWLVTRELQLVGSNDSRALVKGVAPGAGRVLADVGGALVQADITVTAKDDKDSDTGLSGPELQRLTSTQRTMAQWMYEARRALAGGEPEGAVAKRFFDKVATLGLDAPMVELNRLKTRLTEVGLADAALGDKFGGGGTPVEKALLVHRRQVTLEAIRGAVRRVAGRFGSDAVGSVFLAKIGKWAVQNPEMFVLAGDIDFSFVGARPEVILALRDAFADIIKTATGLDMVAIDSVATAHGFAELMVYMGIQGRKFADDAMMAMDHGVERIDFANPDSVGTDGAEAVSGRQALMETVLEQAALRYRDSPHEATSRDLAARLESTWNDRRGQTVEPMLSMEMVRHLQKDIVANVDVFTALDVVKKGSKYLRRSNDQITGDLGLGAADPAWAEFARQVDEMAKTATGSDMARFIHDGLARLGAPGLFEMRVVDGRAELDVAPGGAEAFLAKVQEMIWKNVSNGLDTRIAGLTDAFNVRGAAAGPGTPDDLRPERLADTLRMLAAGLEAMKADATPVPVDILRKVSALTKLIEGHAGQRAFALPPAELEKIRELLQDAAAHNDALLLRMGAVVGHIDTWLVRNYDALARKAPAGTALTLADAKIDALNSVLDILDDTTLGALRDRGVIALDLGTDPATGKRRAIVASFPRIAAINQRLNQSILGRLGNNTAFKAFNLAQECDAYYAALTQAATPGEALQNLSAEIFRRRVPGGGAAEALYMGNYLRAGVEVVYMIFPPLAVPEGLYGLAQSMYDAGYRAWWNAELELLIDGLYAEAVFVDGEDGAPHLRSVVYNGNLYARDELLQARAFLLDEGLDQTLANNLRQADPFLQTLEELQKHGAAGEKVVAHFQKQARERWIQIKREFVHHLVEKLEKRRAAEVAEATGKLPALYGELMAAADELAIRDQVEAALAEEWDTGGLTDFGNRLRNAWRTGVWGGPRTESESTRGAVIIMRMREAYRTVLAARDALEADAAGIANRYGLPTQPREQHGQRLLTGIVFLNGHDDHDLAAIRPWKGAVGRITAAVEQELGAIKTQYGAKPDLDSDLDRRTAGWIAVEDLWLRALKTMKVPAVSAASFRRAAETRQASRDKLVREFRARYAGATGTASVRVLEEADGAPPIATAAVTLRVGDEARRADHRGGGLYELSGLDPGTYPVEVRAEGFTSASGQVTVPDPDAAAAPAVPTLRLRRLGGDNLLVEIQVDPADGRIRDRGDEGVARLAAQVTPLADSGRLSYQWVVGAEVLAQGAGVDAIDFRGEGRAGQTVTVDLVVVDEKGREGRAQAQVTVTSIDPLVVTLAPHRAEIGDDESETLEVTAPLDPGVTYRWQVRDGARVLVDKEWDRRFVINGPEYAGRELTVTVDATAPDGRAGRTETRIKVRGPAVASDEPDKDDGGAQRPGRRKSSASDGPDTAAIAAALAAGDWRALSDMQDKEQSREDRFDDVAAYEARLKPIFDALETLKQERLAWALAWKDYVNALEGADWTAWKAVLAAVEKKRTEVALACGEKCPDRDDPCREACVDKSYEFSEACIGDLDDRALAERQLIRRAQKEVHDRVLTLESAGYRSYRHWFEDAEDIAETYALPFPYPDPVVPRLDYRVDCATVDLPTAQKKKGDLTVRVQGPAGNVALGQAVSLTATVQGGKAPYAFAWAGAAGTGATATATVTRPGALEVVVTVADAAGKRGEGRLTLRTAGGRWQVAGAAAQVPYGGTANLAVQGPDLDGGDLRVVWQASPELAFARPTSGPAGTAVTWDRVGEVKLWCEIQKRDGGAYATLGECDQVTVQVAAPAFTLAFDPPDGAGFVGQDVRVLVVAEPPVPDELLDFRWISPESANRLEITPNAGEIAFRLRGTDPTALRVLARVPAHGDEIAQVEGTYTGRSYTVQARVRPPANPPMAWDAATGGLKPAPPGAHAVHDRISLTAELSGGPPPATVRWTWTVNPGTTLGNAQVQNPTVTRSEAGTVEAQVTARDGDGLELGRGQVTVTVVDPSPPTPTGADGEIRRVQADTLATRARAAADGGDLAAAAAAVDELRRLDPAAARPVAAQVAAKASDRGWQAVRDRDFPAALDDLRLARDLAPDNGIVAQRLAEADRFAPAWPRVEAEAARFDGEIAAHKVFTAQKTMLRMQDLQHDMPGGMANPLSRRVMSDFNAALADYNRFIAAQRANHDRLVADGDWAGVLENAAQTRTWELSPAEERNLASSEALARDRLRDERRTAQERGLPPGSRSLAKVTGNKGAQVNLPLRAGTVASLWIWITQPSEVTARGHPDSARIGEVQVFAGGRTVQPGRITAESDYGRGYSAAQAADGVTAYTYLNRGARGWTSALKEPGQATWLRLDFDPPVRPDRVVVTTAPSRPYQVHSLEVLGASGAEPVAEPPPQPARTAPDIAGTWYEDAPGTPHVVQVSQTGDRFTARCSYPSGGGTASWVMEGTIDGRGHLVAQLRHDNMPRSRPGAWQDRDMQLGDDGATLTGRASWSGGGHALTWRREGKAVAEPAKPPLPPGPATTPAPDGLRRTVALSRGWDQFNDPLGQGSVTWGAVTLSSGGIFFSATFELRGARPNHTYVAGVHFFEPPGTQAAVVGSFGGYKVGAERSRIRRESRTATTVGAWDFGKLTTDGRGDARAVFEFPVPARAYHLQFTVRVGACEPARGVTSGCATVFRSGGHLGETLESFGADLPADLPADGAKTAETPPPWGDKTPQQVGTYDGPGIRVRTGTYGGNCGAPFGNVTRHLAQACDGKDRCEYTIDYKVIGDPKYGCAKDYVAVWRCPDDDVWHSAGASPEAGFRKKVVLECAAAAAAATTAGGDGKAAPAVSAGRTAALTRGWDLFDEPLAQGAVTWRAATQAGGGIRFSATLELRGARPNHAYVAGVHFFEPSGAQAAVVESFGGYKVGAKRSRVTRDKRSATTVGAWDFGKLATDAQGNARAAFDFTVPARAYHLQFTVRRGTCQPDRGVTTGCAVVFRSGGHLGETLESFGTDPAPAAGTGKATPATGPETGTGTGSGPETVVGVAGLVKVETKPGIYTVSVSGDRIRVTKTGPMSGNLQNAGMRLTEQAMGGTAAGDFEIYLRYDGARIAGSGLNQIELQATFEGGPVFFVVRDREGRGCHVWAPGLRGDAPGGTTGTLRIVRQNGLISGYCDMNLIWSNRIAQPLKDLRFVLQNNLGSNDPTDVTFSEFRFKRLGPVGAAQAGTARATATQAALTAFTWHGMAEDRVGQWGNGRPDGTPDGHFRLGLDLPAGTAITSVAVYSADSAGRKAGGHVWHSGNSSYWMLGLVRDGRQLNPSHVPGLGTFAGAVTLDLFANSSGIFRAGQTFLVEATLGDGRVLHSTLRL
ncbi:MAG: PKD domain-containing protein [Hyphomicrobiales bacterium]|nr:PKD domain-containing protein [Hyphomicrobiales bacterium]MCP5373423.1 PKD domain-containing protein [Hyphomicrobiales bacterium]